ncbi:protein DEK-like isoform X1 [Carassius gibelio]|uniref:protein DEK-like isoform X1 n=1 Tax=Carassius gibelio TaxID=101364 RepID=UPI0022781B91|nr:protein DEK-like isoform X1 [Carassius gibelio]
MGRGSPIPPMLRQKIVEQFQKGTSRRKIAKSLKLSSSTVHNIILRFRESGTISVRKGQGRKKRLDAFDLWALRRHCKDSEGTFSDKEEDDSKEEEKSPPQKKSSTTKSTKKSEKSEQTTSDESDQDIHENKNAKKTKKKPATKRKAPAKPVPKTKKADSSSNRGKKKASKSKDESESSDDDQPLIKMVKKYPPTQEQLKETIKDLLKDANLEEVTMNQITRKVHDKYPDFDLSSRKEFIRETVKGLIS